MDQNYASICNFIIGSVKGYNVTPYYENVRAGFKVPALHFPLPEQRYEKATLGKVFNCDNTAYIKVFAMSDDDAMQIAQEINKAIAYAGRYIPVLNIDGNKTSDYIYVFVNSISRIDDCVAQIIIGWNNKKLVNSDDNDKAMRFNFNIGGD